MIFCEDYKKLGGWKKWRQEEEEEEEEEVRNLEEN
jgi:hypothetical protein